MHEVCLYQVQAHGQRRTPSLRLDVLQRGGKGVQCFIKGCPAGLQQLGAAIDLLCLPGLRVESAENAWGSIVGHRASRDPVNDGEISQRGGQGKGDSGPGGNESVASAGSQQLLESEMFIFPRSQPSHPCLDLGKVAAFWSALNSDSKHPAWRPPLVQA